MDVLYFSPENNSKAACNVKVDCDTLLQRQAQQQSDRINLIKINQVFFNFNTRELFSEQKRPVLTMVGPTGENLVLDPLAV